MRDQAEELRNLVLRAALDQQRPAGPPPQLIVLGGGKGGVGVTTIAVNLALAIAEQGARVILIDADVCRADVAAMCQVDEQSTIADILNGTRDIHEVLQPGPAGIQLVPGSWAPQQPILLGDKRLQRLVNQIRGLGRHADKVIVDVGTGLNDAVRRFWELASQVVMVTTPDKMAVMDTYASIKSLRSAECPPSLQLVVNKIQLDGEAEAVHHRMQNSCQRFLGQSLDLLGHVPRDPGMQAHLGPYLLGANDPRHKTVRALQSLAGRLMQITGRSRQAAA